MSMAASFVIHDGVPRSTVEAIPVPAGSTAPHDSECLAGTVRDAAARGWIVAEFMDAIPGLAWTAHSDGAIENVNKRFRTYVGASPDEIVGANWLTFVHLDDLAVANRGTNLSGADGVGDVEARLRRGDGTYRRFLFRVTPLQDETGRIVKWLGVGFDIETRKRRETAMMHEEKALAERERKFEEMIDTVPAAVWSALPDGALEFSNQSYLSYVGLTLEELQGWGWTTCVHPDDLPGLAAAWRKLLESGRGGDMEARLRRQDGKYRCFLMRAHPLYGKTGAVRKWLCVSTDIEDRKRTEEILRDVRSELDHMTRVMSLGQISAAIAHEVNQPIAGIIMNARTSLRMLSADAPNVLGAQEAARRTIRDGERASEAIAKLHGLFEQKQIAAESVDLNVSAREALASAATELAKSKVSVSTDLCLDLPPISGDRIQVQQVIRHLILNAVDAMRGVGDRVRNLTITTTRQGTDQVRLSVKDEGIGFAPEAQQSLFRPFYTTKRDGLGLGLCVCRTVIENHNGRIWAETNDGPGAIFHFTVPCAQETTIELNGTRGARSSFLA